MCCTTHILDQIQQYPELEYFVKKIWKEIIYNQDNLGITL